MDRACPDRTSESTVTYCSNNTQRIVGSAEQVLCKKSIVGVYARTNKGMNLEFEEQPSQAHCVPVSFAGTVPPLT